MPTILLIMYMSASVLENGGVLALLFWVGGWVGGWVGEFVGDPFLFSLLQRTIKKTNTNVPVFFVSSFPSLY